MTREEAISMIEDDIRLHHEYLSGKYRKALRVAILALEQPEIIKCEECIWWNRGNCYSEDGYVESLEYMDGDLRTESDHFCGYAKRREG